MKVYLLTRKLINWETGDNEFCWWVYETEEKAKEAFDKELQEFYDEYGKKFSYSHMSDEMAVLEVNEQINFTLMITEEPVL